MALGKKAAAGPRPVDSVSNMLNAGVDQGVSNQLRMTGPGPIKPQVLQPKNLSKRVTNLRLPANLNA